MANVTFWKDADFTGHYKNYASPISVPDLNQVQWQGESRDDMKDDISSIQTSTETWVRVYSKANYSGRTVLIGPSSAVNMKDVKDDDGSDDMDDTIESFQLFDHKPEVNTTNIINNFLALYPGSVHSTLHNLYNSEFYAQNSEYRVYDPTITLSDNKVSFKINLDHVQAESDDHAVVTFSMDLSGDFVDSISVTYDMADASQIPDWMIKLIDGAIDVTADAAKLLADGAEIVITDGVGVVATVETDKLIDYTAKALTFCVDHLNTVLSAVYLYQDDGGTTNFPAIASHSIARGVLAYYQELFGPDTNALMSFSQQGFFNSLGVSGWASDYGTKNNPYVSFIQGGYNFRCFYPDNTFFYARGGALSSAKIDAVTDGEKDDHLILQAALDPQGRLFTVVGAIDIFSRSNSDDYVAPASGILTYDKTGQMVNILQDGTIISISYDSLQSAYADLMLAALNASAAKYDTTVTDQQFALIDASVSVLAAITAAI